MKTEQEQIKELTEFMLEVSGSANVEPVFVDENGEEMRLNKGATSLLNDILEQAFIPYLAQKLIENGYGDVSKYKKRLKQSEDNFLALTTKNLDLTREKEKLKAENKELSEKNKVLKDGIVKAFTNGFNDGRKQVEKDIRRAKIDVLNKVKEKVTSGSIDEIYRRMFFYGYIPINWVNELIKELQKK